MPRRAVRALLLLAAPLCLQGCVVAVIPAIAASSIAKTQLGRKRAAPVRTASVAAMPSGATLLPLKALPAPNRAPDPTMQFTNYALMTAAGPARPKHSMVLAPSSRLEQVEFLPCADDQPLAVAIDAGLAAAPNMVEALRRLRAFNIEALWIADVGEVDRLRAALTGSGAWKNGDAPILTTGFGAETKEAVRREATRAFCVVAVAGARRGDVEELYAYLRDPIAAAPLERYWNAGWFVVPAAAIAQ
jgi:hypothetical protein